MKKIEYLQLCRPYEFSSPFEGEPFAICLYIADPAVAPDEQIHLSREIVRQGCRYAVCAGNQCSSWDDSIDAADLERNSWEVNQTNFVMTTWHPEESIQEIAGFFLNNTCLDNWIAEKLLVVVVGDGKQVLANFKDEIERQEAHPGQSGKTVP